MIYPCCYKNVTKMLKNIAKMYGVMYNKTKCGSIRGESPQGEAVGDYY